jgi:hypothetical protein
MTHRDPLRSRHDTTDSIGAEPCGCSSIGLSLPSFDAGGALSLGELEDVANETIGKAANAYADAQGVVEDAIEMGKGVEDAVNDLTKAGNDVADVIMAVASSPITHASLGALAVVAPPFTTVLAGIGEMVVGYAAGVVELVKVVESVFIDVFGSTEEKTARAWGMSTAEVKKILAYRESREKARKDWDANQKKATTQLAEIRAAALTGDKKAIAMNAVLNEMMRKDTLLLSTILRYGCAPEVYHVKAKGSATGLTPGNLCDVARVVLEDEKRAQKMSQKDFDHYIKLGRGVYTDSKGRQSGYNFGPLMGPNGGPSLDVNGQPMMAITDVATGKVIAKGQAAIAEWQKGFHFLIDAKTRRVKLDDALRLDINALFADTLYKNWEKLDMKAAAEADRLAQKAFESEAIRESNQAIIKAAKKRADAKRAAMRLDGIPVSVGDTTRGILIQEKDGKLSLVGPTYFRITDDRSGGLRRLVTPKGRVVRNYWQKVS